MASQADQAIYDLCKAEERGVIEFPEKLVNMDSGSDDYPELHAKQAVLMDMLKELGAAVRTVEAAPPRQGTYNIVAEWKGAGDARIMYMNHYDTVWPKGEAARRPFAIRDNVAYGPGVSDTLCNFAAFRAMLRILLVKLGEKNFDRLTALFNCDEEKASLGSCGLIQELAAQHDVVYSLDGGGHAGERVTVSARGGAFCELHITGVESHSGAAPEKGRNAGYEMAHQIMQMRDLSDREMGTDVNWTMGNFGIKSNVIPGRAMMHANIRVTRKSEMDRVENDIRERIKNKLIPDCRIEVRYWHGRPPFQPNAETDKLFACARRIGGEINWPLEGEHSGGGTDSNYSSQVAPALEGLGLGGGGAHTPDEFLPLANIVPRLYLLVRLTRETLRGAVLPIGTKK
jgi:glutamate carboxypeptidase